MDMEFRLFESLPCLEHFLLTTSILDCKRAASYDVVGASRMIVPGEHFPWRYKKLPHGQCRRAIKELRMGNGANSDHDSSCGIRRDDTDKNQDTEANYNLHLAQSVRFHG
jgi:hypothetical protein